MNEREARSVSSSPQPPSPRNSGGGRDWVEFCLPSKELLAERLGEEPSEALEFLLFTSFLKSFMGNVRMREVRKKFLFFVVFSWEAGKSLKIEEKNCLLFRVVCCIES